MNKSLKFNLIVMLILVCFISLLAYKNNISSFSQAQAITQIIKIHPEFPANTNDTITKDIEVRGGPNILITTAKVKFITKIEAVEKNSYINWFFFVILISFMLVILAILAILSINIMGKEKNYNS